MYIDQEIDKHIHIYTYIHQEIDKHIYVQIYIYTHYRVALELPLPRIDQLADADEVLAIVVSPEADFRERAGKLMEEVADEHHRGLATRTQEINVSVKICYFTLRGFA